MILKRFLPSVNHFPFDKQCQNTRHSVPSMTAYRIGFYTCVGFLFWTLLFHNTSTMREQDLVLLQGVQLQHSTLLDNIAVILVIAGAPFASILVIGLLSF